MSSIPQWHRHVKDMGWKGVHHRWNRSFDASLHSTPHPTHFPKQWPKTAFLEALPSLLLFCEESQKFIQMAPTNSFVAPAGDQLNFPTDPTKLWRIGSKTTALRLEKDARTLWCHQTWPWPDRENPQTEWRFLAGKIIHFYCGFSTAMFDDTGGYI